MIFLYLRIEITTLFVLCSPLLDLGLVVESKAGNLQAEETVLYDAIHKFYLIGIDISRTYTEVVIRFKIANLHKTGLI
jgi:hypothetical protein